MKIEIHLKRTSSKVLLPNILETDVDHKENESGLDEEDDEWGLEDDPWAIRDF
jgi:hypothetical protein